MISESGYMHLLKSNGGTSWYMGLGNDVSPGIKLSKWAGAEALLALENWLNFLQISQVFPHKHDCSCLSKSLQLILQKAWRIPIAF